MSQREHPNPLPTTPPRALLVSMAMRMHHDFGVDKHEVFPGHSQGFTQAERESVIADMARLYEEVSGHGFYQWGGSRDAMYEAWGRGEPPTAPNEPKPQ
jgi:hypothetical protein